MEKYPEIGDPGDKIYKWIKDAVSGAENMPLNVQVIGRPWQEETVIAAMKSLDEALHK